MLPLHLGVVEPQKPQLALLVIIITVDGGWHWCPHGFDRARLGSTWRQWKKRRVGWGILDVVRSRSEAAEVVITGCCSL
jgi:hypothetical protein